MCELGWQGERRLLLYTSPTAAARGSDSRRSLPRVAAQSSRIARGQPSRPVLELPRSACVHTRAALAERRYIEHQSIDATMAQSSPSTVSIISIAGGGKCIAVVGELGGERVAPHGCALFSHALTVRLITHRHLPSCSSGLPSRSVGHRFGDAIQTMINKPSEGRVGRPANYMRFFGYAARPVIRCMHMRMRMHMHMYGTR